MDQLDLVLRRFEDQPVESRDRPRADARGGRPLSSRRFHDLGERVSGPRRSVPLRCVMLLDEVGGIAGSGEERSGNLRGLEEQPHTDREVARVHQRSPTALKRLGDPREVVLPSRRAADHPGAGNRQREKVFRGGIGRGELEDHLGLRDPLRREAVPLRVLLA